MKKLYDIHFCYYSRRLHPVVRDLIDYYTDEILTNKYLFFPKKKLLVKYFICYTEALEGFISDSLKNKNVKA